MRFFTPELYVRFNSADDDEADRAEDAWDAALRSYRQHLEGLRDRLPSQVRKLSELCLHDAEFLGYDEAIDPLFSPAQEPNGQPPNWLATAIVSVKLGGKTMSLVYLLWDHVREFSSAADWPFSKARAHWLYDEIDMAAGHGDRFLHRVLLSDGRILEIPFSSAHIHSIPSSPSDKTIGVRQSA